LNIWVKRIKKNQKQIKKKGKRPPKKICNRGNQEEYTFDDLNTLLKDKVFIEKSIQMMEKTEKENKDSDNDNNGIPVYYPKQRLDITSVHGKIGHLPKTIGEENKRPEKGQYLSKDNKDKEKHENNTNSLKSHGNPIIINSNVVQNKLDLINIEETKDQKKLRKKIVKRR